MRNPSAREPSRDGGAAASRRQASATGYRTPPGTPSPPAGVDGAWASMRSNSCSALPRSEPPPISTSTPRSKTSRRDGGARGGNVRTLRSKRLGQACEGADQIRTGVRGFAGLCLTSRPRRREGHRSPRFRGWPAGYSESMARSKPDELREQAASHLGTQYHSGSSSTSSSWRRLRAA